MLALEEFAGEQRKTPNGEKGLVEGDYLVSCNNISDNTPELCWTHHFNRIQDIRSEDSSARASYWAVLHLGND